MLDRNTWNHLTVCKQMSSGLFRIIPKNYSYTNPIFDIYKCYIPYQWTLMGMSHSSYCYIPYLRTLMVCSILHKNVWPYCEGSNLLIKKYTNSSGLPFSRCWRVLYFDNDIKISISFPTSVLVISHSVTFC